MSGIVQGVYYRASARREGERCAACAAGCATRATAPSRCASRAAGEAVDAMLDWCRVGPPAARVSRLTVSDAPADETFTASR